MRPGLAIVVALLATGCVEAEEPGTAPRATRATRAGGTPGPAVPGVDEAEAERLRALGYVDVVESPRRPAGSPPVTVGASRAGTGLTHITNAHGCSAQLVTGDGAAVHTWAHEPCFTWGNSVLLPNGDLVVIHRSPAAAETPAAVADARELLRLDFQGEVVWRRRIPAHHDVATSPGGGFATLTYRHRIEPRYHAEVPVREDFVQLLDDRGELLEEVSLLELLESAPDPFRLKPRSPRYSKRDFTMELDLSHANSLEWMPWPELEGRGPPYSGQGLLLCLRNQDAVVVVDWKQRKVVWTWGQAALSGPHDATWLANGNILIFDNGLGRGWSRVLEVDPASRRIVWEYRGPEPERFFTETRGASQRLPDGNTLITESGSGRVFEITPDGEVVWDFYNPNLSAARKPIVIVRARRLGEADLQALRFEQVD